MAQTLLDVISEVTRDLRHTASFGALLRPLDDAAARRVAQRYVDFLYQVLADEPGQRKD
jgi:hypothetical protein